MTRVAWYRARRRAIVRKFDAIALSRPGAVPPGNRLGLYLGHDHLYATQRDPAGTLLFFERHGAITRTNLEPPFDSGF